MFYLFYSGVHGPCSHICHICPYMLLPLYPFYDLGKHNSLVTLATSTRTTAHDGKASNTLVIHIRDWGHYKACQINVNATKCQMCKEHNSRLRQTRSDRIRNKSKSFTAQPLQKPYSASNWLGIIDHFAQPCATPESHLLRTSRSS